MENRDDDVVTLSDALRAVAEDDAALAASPRVEAALRDQVRRTGRTRRRLRVAAAFALAATVVLAVALPAWLRSRSPAALPGSPAQIAAAAANKAPEITTAFLPLEYSSVPLSHGELVRMTV